MFQVQRSVKKHIHCHQLCDSVLYPEASATCFVPADFIPFFFLMCPLRLKLCGKCILYFASIRPLYKKKDDELIILNTRGWLLATVNSFKMTM